MYSRIIVRQDGQTQLTKEYLATYFNNHLLTMFFQMYWYNCIGLPLS